MLEVLKVDGVWINIPLILEENIELRNIIY